MPKKIHVKLYNKAETFKRTLNVKQFWSEIRFTETINYGLGNFNFRYGVGFDDTTFIHGDIIKVYKDGTDLIYKGFVIGIKRVIEPNGAYLDISCIGMQAALSYRMYTSASSYTFTKTDDAADIVTDILGVYNNSPYSYLQNKDGDNLTDKDGNRLLVRGSVSADGPVFTDFVYTAITIPSYGTTISIDFDKDTCRTALKKVLDTVDRNIRFLGENEVYYKDSYSSHKLNFENEISQIVTDEKSDQLYNDYTVQRSGGNVLTEDVTSQTAYGRRERYIADTGLKTSGTGTERANKELAANKDPKFNTSILVNSNYDIESIHCGDTISIFNTGYSIMNKKVVKIEYEVETARVYVDDYDSIEKALSNI